VSNAGAAITCVVAQAPLIGNLARGGVENTIGTMLGGTLGFLVFLLAHELASVCPLFLDSQASCGRVLQPCASLSQCCIRVSAHIVVCFTTLWEYHIWGWGGDDEGPRHTKWLVITINLHSVCTLMIRLTIKEEGAGQSVQDVAAIVCSPPHSFRRYVHDVHDWYACRCRGTTSVTSGSHR
jgi:hypothetical protein